jgi:hypothetical protein
MENAHDGMRKQVPRHKARKKSLTSSETGSAGNRSISWKQVYQLETGSAGSSCPTFIFGV